MTVAIRPGDDRFAARPRLRGDVLQRFELLGGDASRVVEQPHAGRRRLDGERSQHADDRRRQPGGADSEEKRDRVDAHGGNPPCKSLLVKRE